MNYPEDLIVAHVALQKCPRCGSQKCPRCGSTENDTDQGGNECCFHCFHCRYLQCLTEYYEILDSMEDAESRGV